MKTPFLFALILLFTLSVAFAIEERGYCTQPSGGCFGGVGPATTSPNGMPLSFNQSILLKNVTLGNIAIDGSDLWIYDNCGNLSCPLANFTASPGQVFFDASSLNLTLSPNHIYYFVIVNTIDFHVFLDPWLMPYNNNTYTTWHPGVAWNATTNSWFNDTLGNLNELPIYRNIEKVGFEPLDYCGDALCLGNETCTTCATDCGVCPKRGGGGSDCGDNTCTSPYEDQINCPADCGSPPEEVVLPPEEEPPLFNFFDFENIKFVEFIREVFSIVKERVQTAISTPSTLIVLIGLGVAAVAFGTPKPKLKRKKR